MLFDYLTGVRGKFYADLSSLPETLLQYPLNISRWSEYHPGTGLVMAAVVSDLILYYLNIWLWLIIVYLGPYTQVFLSVVISVLIPP